MTRRDQRVRWARSALHAAARDWSDAEGAAVRALVSGRWTASERWRAVLATARAIRHIERAQRHMMLVDAAAKEGKE